MEIDITDLFYNLHPSDVQASIAEIGNGAAESTWGAAKEEAIGYEDILKGEEEVEAFISHMKSMGFSEAQDLDEWPKNEVVALFIQLVAGDMREFLEDFSDNAEQWDWDEYEAREDIGGSLFNGTDGKIYYYLGDY